MRIGELAKRTNCDTETIRYYEKIGLLEEPARSTSGYRAYQPEHQEQLQFIRHCRSLQMGLPEIRMLLQLKREPGGGCARVDDLLELQIGRVRAQMDALIALEEQLVALRRCCPEPQSIENCGILHNLDEAVSARK